MGVIDVLRQTKEYRPITTGPTAEAIEAYRQAVFAAVEGTGPAEVPADILRNAWKINADCQRDLGIYKERVRHREVLDVEVPKLQQQAAVAKESAERAAQLLDLPLANTSVEGIVGELRLADAAMDLANHGQRLMFPPLGKIETVAQLTEAIQAHSAGAVYKLRPYAAEMQGKAAAVTEHAQRELHRTACKAIHQKIGELQLRISQLQGAIKGRDEVLNVEKEIARVERRCERLARGERIDDPPAGMYSPGVIRFAHEEYDVPTAELYRRERVKLDHLRLISQHRAAAIAENEADAAEIAKLQAKIPPLDEECLSPRNLEWST